jgi:hypothetical protein
MLQYKIPQNVQMEDKITSFLTIRQLIICAIGGGIAYILYISLAPTYYAEVWLPPVAFIILLTVAIAFVKINDISFSQWFLLLLEFMIRPRIRVWDKKPGNQLLYSFVTAKRVSATTKKKKNEDSITSKKSLSALDELSAKLDTNPFETIGKKKSSIDKVKDRELLHATIMTESKKKEHEKRLEQSIKDRDKGIVPEKKKKLSEVLDDISAEGSSNSEQSATDKIMSLSKRVSPVREHSHVNTIEKPNIPKEHKKLLDAINQNE